MERNRWETALRCLEIAVHPHTKDEEVIAAVNGFRRTADGTPLSRLCRELAGSAPSMVAERENELDRFDLENRELRRRMEEAETDRIAALRRLDEAEQNARDIAEALLAAEHRAETAEHLLTEFRGAYGRLSGGLRPETPNLRHEFEAARRNPAASPQRQPAPFQNFLDDALQRPAQTPPSPPTPMSSRPWTA